MDARVRGLICKAQKKYGMITPCGNKTWDQCIVYNEVDHEWWLWFNTPDGNTHTVS
jgi:hypothetical protein